MRSAIADDLPNEASDKRKHCLAAALIAQRCSVAEAYLAAVGTEIVDSFGPGAAEWEDWRADRAGIACARTASAIDSLQQCCEQRGY
jgi:hypothetical protein